MAQPLPRSIARRLAALTIVASALALVTSSFALSLYDRQTFTESFSRRLGWQADIVAANSASALVFDDPMAATVTVSALKAVPSTVRAAVYRADGGRLAEYHRDGEAPADTQLAGGFDSAGPPAFTATGLRVTRPILVHGKPVGTVLVEADLTELNRRRRDYVLISVVILVMSVGLTLLFSRRWQQRISDPIESLQQMVVDITRDQDYSRRAPADTPISELNVLARSVNGMLDEIELRNRALHAAHDELEARVRARTAELQTVNQELEAFSYSVSHDLRAPLRHVSGFSELLADHAGPTLDEQGRKYLATINGAARRMATLIDDLLAFSRISRSALTLQPVSLGKAVEQARKEVMTENVAATRKVDWQVADLPTIHADAAMLHQVFVNLFANALKYSSTRDQTRIEIGLAPGGADEAVVYVRDNGVGFDMKYVDKLFGVFQRLHKASEFEGTGIGLANIKRIVTRHGGRVWAEGAINAGATFYVALPIGKDHA